MVLYFKYILEVELQKIISVALAWPSLVYLLFHFGKYLRNAFVLFVGFLF